jgi:hypothetical protein
MATAVTAPPSDQPTIPAIAVPATVPARDATPLAVPVTLLRAAAALFGVYGYLVTLWLARHGSHPEPIATVREWLSRPLGVGEDFGPLAMMLLLAATGYLAAARGFRVWRLLHAYLPVLVVTVLAAAAVLAGIDVWTTPPDASVTAANVAANLTFVSHLVAAKTVLVPLAWVAGLQLVAWLVALDRRTWPTVLVLLGATGVLCVFADNLAHLGRPLLFLPLVLVGHVTWRVLDRALPLWAGGLLVTAGFAAIIAVDRNFAGLAQWWYPVAATYAVLLLLVAIRTAGPTAATIAAHPVTRWLAARAEWLVLLGGVVGFAVLEPLRETVPVPLGMVAALVAVGLAADACHRLTGVITKTEPA